MGSLNTIHTLVPTYPNGYFDADNVHYIQMTIRKVLSREFKQTILIDEGSIKRVMQRVVEDRIESVPRMNQRVVMEICNEFRNHQNNVDKHLRYEEYFRLATGMYNPISQYVQYDSQVIKPKTRLGKPNVGGTVRFYFT